MDGAAGRVRASVFRGKFWQMARDAHMEAARHHLEAASKHLAAVDRYNDGDPEEAMQQSHEARVASELADNMSIEAHRQTIVSLVTAGD